MLLLIYVEHSRALSQHAFVSSQSHCSAHVCYVLLLLHDVDDVVGSLFVHFSAVGVCISKDVSGKLDYHHLHAKTYTECGYVVQAGVFDGGYLALDTSLSESRTYYHTVESFQFLRHVSFGEILRIDEVQYRLAVIVSTCLVEAFPYALIGILQVVLAHQSDVHLFCGFVLALQEAAPWAERGSFAHRHVQFAEYCSVESLFLHINRNFVY